MQQIKAVSTVFQKPEYQTALKQPAFMAYFADMLTDSHLKPMIYDHIIEYYRFRGLNPADMYEEAAKLYYVLDDKRGMKKKRAGFWQGFCRWQQSPVSAQVHDQQNREPVQKSVWISVCCSDRDCIDVYFISSVV